MKAIIFDKDGTLIDFDAVWVPISYFAIKEFLRRINKEDVAVEKILSVFGIENGVTDINGIICKGTYALMGQAIYDFLKEDGFEYTVKEITEIMIECYHNNMQHGDIKPTVANITEILGELKDRGIKLAVVTTDDAYITEKCLKAIDVYDYFDFIYTDDGKNPTKPDPYYINKFCEDSGIEKSEILMVGDTQTDVLFAKNSGVKFMGVAKTENNKAVLSKIADTVANGLSYLFNFI